MSPHYADLYSQSAEGASQPAELLTQAEDLEGDAHPVEMSTTDPNDAPIIPEPNDDPLRSRITNNQYRSPLTRWLINVLHLEKPEPTMEEIAQMDDSSRVKLLNKILKEEAQAASLRIQNALDRMGFSFRVHSPEGELKRHQKVNFDFVQSTEDAHWLHVDMDTLPYGINSSDLIEQKVLDDLGKSVGHKVNLRSSDESGIWYIIERASGQMGIPIHVPINDMLRRFPPSATNLTLPLGMTTNRRAMFEDLDTMVHCLVAGETGGGKSNCQNVIISVLASRNTPEQLQMILMDMKAGLEFQFYEDLPHLIKIPGITDTGIIEHPDKVYPVFAWLIAKEAQKRMDMIRASKHRSIDDYNTRRVHNRLPRLLVICDEWGIARLGDKGKEAEIELSKSVMLLRAVGIHVIIGTQTPTKDVLGLLVRSNLPTKICFNCNEMSASTIVIGNTSAMGLPPGRSIFKRGMGTTTVQWPFISEEMVKSIVASIKEGKAEPVQTQPQKHDVTENDLLTWGLHALGGSLPINDLYKHFSHRGLSHGELREILKNLEGKEVTIDSKPYVIEPGAGVRPRRLVAKAE